MAFFDNGRQEQIDQLTRDNGVLVNTLADTQFELGEAEKELQILRMARDIAPGVVETLRRLHEEVRIGPLTAEEAKQAVVAQEEPKVRARALAAVMKEKGDDFRLTYRAENGEKIRKQVEKDAAEDGTFAKLQEEVEAQERTTIRNEYLEAEKERLRAALQDPAKQAALLEQIKADIRAQGTVEDYRAELEAGLLDTLRPVALAAVKAEIAAEVAEQEDAYLQQEKNRLLETFAPNERKKAEATAHKEWDEKALKEVAQELKDEELLKLLEARAAQARQQLAMETKVTELLTAFTNGGVDTQKIEVNSVLEIQLGSYDQKEEEEKYYDKNGYSRIRNVMVGRLNLVRTLRLTCLGDGRFAVDHDSLHDTKNPFAKDNILEQGTVIVVGRRIKDGANEATLDQRIQAGVHLHVDDDTSTPHITNAGGQVANVILNGVSAKKVDRTVLAQY